MQLLGAPYRHILNRFRALSQWRRKYNMNSEKQEENIKQKVEATYSYETVSTKKISTTIESYVH